MTGGEGNRCGVVRNGSFLLFYGIAGSKSGDGRHNIVSRLVSTTGLELGGVPLSRPIQVTTNPDSNTDSNTDSNPDSTTPEGNPTFGERVQMALDEIEAMVSQLVKPVIALFIPRLSPLLSTTG